LAHKPVPHSWPACEKRQMGMDQSFPYD